MKCIEASFLRTKVRRSITAPNQSSCRSLIVIEPWLGWLNAQMIVNEWHDVLQFRSSLPCLVLIFYFDCTSNKCMECYRTVWKESTCNLQTHVPDLVLVRQAQCNSLWAPIKEHQSKETCVVFQTTDGKGWECNPRYTTPSCWLLGPAVMSIFHINLKHNQLLLYVYKTYDPNRTGEPKNETLKVLKSNEPWQKRSKNIIYLYMLEK